MKGMMAAMAETAAAGDRTVLRVEEFGAWMASEQKRIFLLCLRMLRDSEDADTAAQDTFLKAYRAIERGDAGTLADPARWLTRIAVNTCLDRLRSRRWMFWRRRPSQEDEWTILAMAPSMAPTPEARALAVEIGMRLRKALDRLSGRQRSVFVLKHYEDRTLQEIGEILGLDVGTVKAHMARAVGKLRAELKDLYGTHASQR
jgi:RNA polymerase sigma-70 factor (ECF subfamily)